MFHLVVVDLRVLQLPSFLVAFKHGVTLGSVCFFFVFMAQGRLPQELGLLLRSWAAEKMHGVTV